MAAVSRKFMAGTVKKINSGFLFPVVRLSSSSPKEKNIDEEDLDKPIKYSTSKAATWKAEYSFSGREKEDVTPWYQPIVVSLSLSVFMIYFFILREENDVDKQLDMSLYDRIEGLEEVQLKVAINYYKEHDPSFDTRSLERRLTEIQQMKPKYHRAQLNVVEMYGHIPRKTRSEEVPNGL